MRTIKLAMEKLESVQNKRLDDPVKNDDLSQKLQNVQIMETPKQQILPSTPIKQQQILQPFNSTPIKPVKNNNNGNFPTSFASSNNFTDFQTASNSSNTPILNNLMQSQQHNSSSNSSDLLDFLK